MSFSISVAEAKKSLRLVGSLDESASHMMTVDLFSRLNLPMPCEIDLSGVEMIDQNGLNLLVKLKESGLVARFTRHSSVVLNALKYQPQ